MLIKELAISVIIPVFNAERYLDKTLKIIRNQSLKDIEIICVNDGSSDSSLSILRNHAIKDARIKVINLHSRQGAGFARNMGMTKAVGEYLCFLDADDFFEKDMLKEAYNYATTHHAEIVCFDSGTIDDLGNKTLNKKIKEIQNNLNLAGKFSFSDFNTNVTWNKIFKRSFILETGLQFQLLRTCNDLGFSWSALALANHVYYLNKTLVFYRQNAIHNLSSDRYKYAENIVSAALYIQNNLIKSFKESILPSFYQSIVKCFIYELNKFPRDVSFSHLLFEIENFLPSEYQKLFYGEFLKASIIFPISDNTRNLTQCIETILNQTLKEIEIILVVNGNSEDSLRVAQEYLKKDNRITIYTNKDQHIDLGKFCLGKTHTSCVYIMSSNELLKSNKLKSFYKRYKFQKRLINWLKNTLKS